ncbi:hypothetical protein J3R83DRAFT_12609 [Lanmaoa asiatica]|nr:hypothetical protein J3R83DRAFT_12609 [Lanmaoa asiatica]
MISIIFPASRLLSELPACRATRGCPAYYIEKDSAVYFKDSWHIVADGIVPEGDIYAKLNKEGVPHVPVCLASGEVETDELQRPQTWTCSQDWPINDAAREQSFLDFGLHRTLRVSTTRKPKHALEVIDEQEVRKRPRVTTRKATSDNILERHSTFNDSSLSGEVSGSLSSSYSDSSLPEDLEL